MNEIDLNSFIQTVQDYYQANRRTFEWRENTEPYRVFLSEIMLQQTQTSRVAQKFPLFLEQFPDFTSLAAASLPEVLGQWQGLGYNRRGRFLREAAITICERFGGILPADEQILRSLPGIGPNTAASILAFAFNVPSVFIETNIRTVFIHHFFPETAIHDRDILPLVQKSLDLDNPREWYWALMDYGVYLKKHHGNASRKSSHYNRQSRFDGSIRQTRGKILKVLLGNNLGLTSQDLQIELGLNHEISGSSAAFVKYEQALSGLLKEGMIIKDDFESGLYRIGS